MEGPTSTMQHSYGLYSRGSNPHHGPRPTHPHMGPSRPEDPHQQPNKPFFYIQPQQPYMQHMQPMQSVQWPVPVPMPVSYNPFYGYPGLAYGMPAMMPHYQPCSAYMEPPAFVLPQTQQHLMDYRRMLNSQYYQTMAYHSRRFRYQHNVPTRDLTSAEVQTDPLSLSSTHHTSTSSHGPSSNNFVEHPIPIPSTSTGVKNSQNVPTNQSLSPALAVQKRDHSLEVDDMAASTSTTTTLRPQPPTGSSSFVIQTEEVRIECRATPVGMQLMHSHETAEVSHSFSRDVVHQCSSMLQGRALPNEGHECLSAADQSEENQNQVCPDILLVSPSSSSSSSGGEKTLASLDDPADPSNVTSEEFDVQAAPQSDVKETSSEKEMTVPSKSKSYRYHFDSTFLDELRNMESAVWSMDETLINSPAATVPQNGRRAGSCNEETLAVEVPLAAMLTERDEPLLLTLPEEEAAVIPLIQMDDEPEEMSSSAILGIPNGEIDVSEEVDTCPVMEVTVAQEVPMIESTRTEDVATSPFVLSEDNSPPKADRNQVRRESNVQESQDSSFESLPAYLPSASWLADFDSVYYSNRLPPTPKKPDRPLSGHGSVLEVPSRRRKIELEYKDQPAVRKLKERPKGKGDRQSISDHECCLGRNYDNDNSFVAPYATKRGRYCSRCQTKNSRIIATSASPGLSEGGRSLKRKAVPFQPWNEALLPTCDACKSHPKKQQQQQQQLLLLARRKGSGSSDVWGQDMEGESSENSSAYRRGPKWKASDLKRPLASVHTQYGKAADVKRPLASNQNVDKCPAAIYPKMREKNFVSIEPQSVAWERLRHCPHGNAIRETDENRLVPDKWRSGDQIYRTHKGQTEKSWRAATPYPDGSKNEARAQHLNKHNKSQPQSQGTRRKDTRC